MKYTEGEPGLAALVGKEIIGDDADDTDFEPSGTDSEPEAASGSNSQSSGDNEHSDDSKCDDPEEEPSRKKQRVENSDDFDLWPTPDLVRIILLQRELVHVLTDDMSSVTPIQMKAKGMIWDLQYYIVRTV